MKKLKIALAQLNFTVGDIEGNKLKIIDAAKKAAKQKADLIVFSELAIVGYSPEDLVLRKSFQKRAAQAIDELVKESKKLPAMIVGGIESINGELYNSAFFINNGKVISQQKHELPNYGVFDEKRIFNAGKLPKPISFKGIKIGLMICEDMWEDNVPKAMKAADIIVSINASPFEKDKYGKRIDIVKKIQKIVKKPAVYVNQVGGQDELVFDGNSFVLSANGKLQVGIDQFAEDMQIAEFEKKGNKWECATKYVDKPLSEEESIYKAMVLGLRDYINKNGFPGVIIGLSGGIDSAFSAVIAVDAIGKSRVHGALMPSQFTSQASIREANELAANLEIATTSLSIENIFTSFTNELKKPFSKTEPDITEENLQARIRGMLLMALSNKFGWMVLTTGNKSEMSVGYATLYGDMCGGYSVLKDLYKTEVYKLAKWRNKNRPEDVFGPAGEIIPEYTIKRPPTAELRENQTDQDSLPPYDVLDEILEMFVEKEMATDQIVKKGFAKATVEKILKMLINSEYKRRQAPPGVKISSRSFGRDRRYPITNKFKL